MNEFEGLRSSHSDIDLHEVLTKPVTALLGVSQEAADALKAVGIETVFDLGSSFLFATAKTVVELSSNSTVASRLGMISGDLMSESAQFSSIDEIGRLKLSSLRMLTPQQAENLSNTIDIDEIRDLANWPPYLAARKLVQQTLGATTDLCDAGEAEELRPRLGEYPTERVYYTTLVMLHTEAQPTKNYQKIEDGPISLKPDRQGSSEIMEKFKTFVKTSEVNLALKASPKAYVRTFQSEQQRTSESQDSSGSSTIGIGALLTFSQSWYVRGLTLGQMLHSLTLAPGEATRIAVIDWSRRTYAKASEEIGESERLSSRAQHKRSISEIQEGTANDFQMGGSATSAKSHSKSQSYAETDSGFLGFGSDESETSQEAWTDSSASSFGWSLGTRSVTATMHQNVNDRTEQYSTSVRNRRATSVREVSQEEHEQVSTRIVANGFVARILSPCANRPVSQ